MSNNAGQLYFRVPLEESQPCVRELLERAWPEGTSDQVDALFREARVYVDDVLCRKPEQSLLHTSIVRVEVGEGEEVFGLPEADTLARGEGWVVVSKPTGMPGRMDREDVMDPVMFMADLLGLDRDTFTPVWDMPISAGGPWLCGGSPGDAQKLGNALVQGVLMMTWVALVPRVSMPRGVWVGEDGDKIEYGLTRSEHGICEVQLFPKVGSPTSPLAVAPYDAMLDIAAKSGFAVLGDRHRGGYMVEGGLRLRLAALYQEASDLAYSWSPGPDWWPDVPVIEFVEKEKSKNAEHDRAPSRVLVPLKVSAKTLEVLEKHKHPWVLEDAQTGQYKHLAPGSAVELCGPSGERGPVVLVENTGDLVARVWGQDRDEVEDFEEEVELRVDEAIAKRAELLRKTDTTNVFRLIHGEADRLPGFLLDQVGSLLRATLIGKASHAFKELVYANLIAHDPAVSIIEVEHIQDIREAGDSLPQARIVHDGASVLKPGERVIAVEEGLRYWCEPWEGIDVGFFADQRENRCRLRQLVRPDSRWLNLFCHTGAFSVALANEGAHVVSVDLSRRYLDWLEDNFRLNHLSLTMNTSVAADCRDYLKKTNEKFDGMIVDPPTAAAGAGVFWSVRRDYENLLEQCFRRLKPDGVMLVCRNDRKRTVALEKLVRSAASRVGWGIKELEDAPPSADFPSMPGFVEGESFEGIMVYGAGAN